MSDSIEKIVAEMRATAKATSFERMAPIYTEWADRLAALTAGAGFVLVPITPTTAMVRAWEAAPASDDYDVEFCRAYAAMLAAAPKANPAPPTSGKPDPSMCAHKFDINPRRCVRCNWDFTNGDVPPVTQEPTPAQAGAELPELPEPVSSVALAAWGPKPDYYTADQMRAYALLALGRSP